MKQQQEEKVQNGKVSRQQEKNSQNGKVSRQQEEKAQNRKVSDREKKEFLEDIKKRIAPPDEAARQQAFQIWQSVCKPLGSLGLLEEAVIRLAGIYGDPQVKLEKRGVLVVCADHGVVEEQISQSEASVTAQVALAIAQGRSNINVMAEQAGAQVFVLDAGMKQQVVHPRLEVRKVACGTGNIKKTRAMSVGQVMEAIRLGLEQVREKKEQGMQLLVTGEMGIGNTTVTAALAAVLLHCPVEKVTGKGAGLSQKGLEHKICVIEQAIAFHQAKDGDPIELLSQLGGIEIAVMTGICLGGAVYRLPVVLDGVISCVAALLAVRLVPACRDYLFASHVSEEPAGALLLKELALKPVICAQMRLGEGTGGVCLLPLLDLALAEYHHAHRFFESGIPAYVPL